MDRPTMPPAHRDLPDDVTPPGHELVKYIVGPGDLGPELGGALHGRDGPCDGRDGAAARL